MKKMLLFLVLSILGFHSCEQQEIVEVQNSMEDVDLYLVRLTELNKVIYLSKKSDKHFEEKGQELRNMFSGQNVSEAEAMRVLYSNYGITKQQIGELQILANRVYSKYSGSKADLETFLTKRFERLLEDKTISLDYLPSEGGGSGVIGLRASCAWIAIKAVTEGGLKMAAGCLAGPAGCLIGFGLATIGAIDATIKLCEKCGCE